MIDTVLFDVDGVFTDGSFYYSEDGKLLKKFGANDSDGIKFLVRCGLMVSAISADTRGFKITQARMRDLRINVSLVSEKDRFDYAARQFKLEKLAFMGDGIYDSKLLASALYGIAPANATASAKRSADYITFKSGGNGAVFEAAMNIGKIFFPEEFKKFLADGGLNEEDF